MHCELRVIPCDQIFFVDSLAVVDLTHRTGLNGGDQSIDRPVQRTMGTTNTKRSHPTPIVLRLDPAGSSHIERTFLNNPGD